MDDFTRKCLGTTYDYTQIQNLSVLSESRCNYDAAKNAIVIEAYGAGGGDGFSGCLLYGLVNGWEPARCAQFGWATGVLAASSLNDYAEPADEKQVWDIYAGNARVQR